MSKSGNIKIILRVRPTKKPYGGLIVDENDNKVDIHVHRKEARDVVNNKKEDYNFSFDRILNMSVRQENVFENAAKEIVDSVLEGYNGTIFAYGQTGSGKTYTITGGTERYADRGIIPRSLSYVFSEARNRTDMHIKVSVSYLEIYNDEGYDLLDSSQCTRNLSDLPKVIHREDAQGNINLINLSVHRADNEEDALNLLFIGDTNRVVAETPSNDASTRSHCIFIIQIESQKAGSDVKTVSKLHLVDLAGSERVGKTNVDGTLLREARFINQSLHYLASVIEALQSKSSGDNAYIPYRNSFMTLVLRDSLGGNCKTTMIATVSAEESNIDESISTCRFAQRVACIKNTANKNEVIDPSLIISRLRQEIAELKAEIRLLKGEGGDRDHLSPEEIEECKALVEEFANNRDPSAKLLLSDMLKINECFYHFKRIYNQVRYSTPVKGGMIDSGKPMDATTSEEMERMRLLLQQRENELAILVSHIQKRGEAMPKFNQLNIIPPSEETKHDSSPSRSPSRADHNMRLQQRSLAEAKQSPAAPTNISITLEQLQDRNQAFDIFRRSYRKNQAMEDNKAVLKEKIARAKQLTEVINGSRGRIELIKNEIEQLRRANAAQGLVDSDNAPIAHPKEEGLRYELERLKGDYRNGVTELKDLKIEIESIQKLIENSRKKMQTDFEAWLQIMISQSKPLSSSRDLDSSISKATNYTSTTKDSKTPFIDPVVSSNIEKFYKARDDIYKNLKS